MCKKALKCYARAHQFKNLNLTFLTQKRHTRGWGQIIKPTHIVMLFFESLGRFGLTMKKIYLLFPLLLFVFITCEDEKVEDTKEKEPTIIFSKTFGGSGQDYGRSVQQTSDGGYIITGNTRSFGEGNQDVWLIKTDSQGQEEWNQTVGGGSNKETGYYVQQTNDGGYIITGNTDSNGDNITEVWLIKTDSQGNEKWNHTFGGNGALNDIGHSVQQTTDGGYIITGITDSNGDNITEVWLIKIDSQGQEEWNHTFGGIGGYDDVGRSVQQTTDGGFVITGYTWEVYGNGGDLWLIKTDSQGNEEWSSIFGGEYGDRGYSGQPTTDGGYILTGKSYFNYQSDGRWNNGDVRLIKTDSQGNEEWNQTFSGSKEGTYIDGYGTTRYFEEYGSSVQQTSDGGYIITGMRNRFDDNDDNEDVLLIKTDNQGNEQWNQIFGGNQIDFGTSVQQTIDGGFIITGYTESFGNGFSDVWLIKTDSQGREEWNRTYGGSGWDVGRSVQQTTDGGYIIAGQTGSFGNGNTDVWLIKTDSEGNTVSYGD